MFSNFFFSLKKAEIPVSLKEYLTFLDAVKHGVAEYSLNDFYYLSRSSLVKDERHIDRFDQVFGHCFKGLELLDEVFGKEIPEEWLQSLAQLHLTPEEKKEKNNKEGIIWTESGRAELTKVPFFVRGKVKTNTEKYAILRGLPEISDETLYDAKAYFS